MRTFARMRLQRYDILPELQPYVQLICTMDCDHDADTRHIRVLPDTRVELFINYSESPVATIGSELYRNSIVTFRMSKPMEVQMRKGAGCLAVCFHPGMAYRFFSLPMHLFTDTTTDLLDLWQLQATELEDRVAAAPDNTARVAITQAFLLRHLALSQADEPVNFCLQAARHTRGMAKVTELAGKTGLSQRQLARRFQQAVGLPLKEYLRTTRFVQSLQYLKLYPTRSLTDVAYESGYYDQSHFIHDCREYAGCTPGDLIQSPNILY